MRDYISIYCPHCHKHTALEPATQIVSSKHGNPLVEIRWYKNVKDKWWIGVCNCCGDPVLILNEGELIYPNPLPTPTDARIPEKIRVDLEEAKICMNASAFRAAAVIARRAIQHACMDKGATQRNLVDQINALATNGVLTNDLKEWANVVRWVGNDAAHPSNDKVERDDAEDILNLCEQLLNVLYVAPAIAQANRLKRGK